MLAHKAEEEGTFVAEVMAGQHPHIDYNLIPGVGLYLAGSSRGGANRRAAKRIRYSI